MSNVRFIHGDARSLVDLADESVQCVVTSPPYCGLRKYAGEQESVWPAQGGSPLCSEGAHEWVDESLAAYSSKGHWQAADGGATKKNRYNGDVDAARQQADAVATRGTCRKCGAWRGGFGLEPNIEMYVAHTVEILREIWRVLRKDGVVFWNLGDSFAASSGMSKQNGLSNMTEVSKSKRIDRGSGRWGGGNNPAVGAIKPKDLCGIPYRVALAAQADGWWWRQMIVWSKPNPMPESCQDRPTTSHEYILLLTKAERYFWDADAVREPAAPETAGRRKRAGKNALRGQGHFRDGKGPANRAGRDMSAIGAGPERNMRSVWEIPTQPFPEAHFATFPEEIARRCIKAGTSERGACAKCGAPWVRQVERTARPAESHKGSKFDRGKTATHQLDRAQNGDRFETRTVGWRPSCECIRESCPDVALTATEWENHADEVINDLGPVPCVVLDPFAGSGTVGKVAIELNRSAVLVDIAYDPELGEDGYLPMAKRRCSEVQRELVTVPMLDLDRDKELLG